MKDLIMKCYIILTNRQNWLRYNDCEFIQIITRTMK